MRSRGGHERSEGTSAARTGARRESAHDRSDHASAASTRAQRRREHDEDGSAARPRARQQQPCEHSEEREHSEDASTEEESASRTRARPQRTCEEDASAANTQTLRGRAVMFHPRARDPCHFSYISLPILFLSPYMLPLSLRLGVIHLRAALFIGATIPPFSHIFLFHFFLFSPIRLHSSLG